MANVQAMCTSFKKELLNGSHAFGAQAANGVRTVTTKDTFKGALYVTTATTDSTTTAYSATNEVSGTGYTAAGTAVTNATAPSTTGTTSFWTPSANLVWAGVTLTTAFDCVLIYNTASTGNLAVSVHTFGAQTITAGTLTLTMPTNDSTNGLIRIA